MAKILQVAIVIFVKEVEGDKLKVWVQKRDDPEGPFNGLLEFPGGKIEVDEAPVAAARREVIEEVEISDEDFGQLVPFKIHQYENSEKLIVLNIFFGEGTPALEDAAGQWLTLNKETLSQPFKGQLPHVNHGFLDEFALYIMDKYQSGNLEKIWKLSLN